MRGWISILVLGMSGCLALASHDGAWPCTDDSDCSGGRVCRSLANMQRQCMDRLTCSPSVPCDPGSWCDSGTCKQQQCTADAQCGTYRCSQYICETSCESDASCRSGAVCESGACTPPKCDGRAPEQCGHFLCADGRCLTECTSAADCKRGYSCLDGQCECTADVSADASNCGSCGHACPKGTSCSGGQCTCTGTQILCGSKCILPASDPLNCGACGKACDSAHPSCIGGECTCYGIVCGGACVDANENCGACGHSCQGGTCSAGVCQPVFLSTKGIFALHLAVDDTHVYWTESRDSTHHVMRAPKNGGTPMVLASPTSKPDQILVDGAAVYWTIEPAHELWTAQKDGSAAQRLVKATSQIDDIAQDATHVYWTSSSSIARISKSTGVSQPFQSTAQQPRRLVMWGG